MEETMEERMEENLRQQQKSTEEEIKKAKLQAGKTARKAFQLLKRNKVSKAS